MSYSKEMEAVIRSASPLNAAKAEEIAQREEFIAAGKSKRSVISKCRSMGLDYEKAVKPAKRGNQPSKADYVDQIAGAVGVSSDALDGLVNAKMSALQNLFEAVS